jgi:hypothetical protein
MHFLTAKAAIERTELFDVLRRLPKGALLHGHMDAMSVHPQLDSYESQGG